MKQCHCSSEDDNKIDDAVRMTTNKMLTAMMIAVRMTKMKTNNSAPGQAGRSLKQSLLPHHLCTAPGHLDEGGHALFSAQRRLDPPQQVVGLKYQDHLSVHESQHVRDLLEILGGVRLDLGALPRAALRHVHTLLDGRPGAAGDHAGEEPEETAHTQLVGRGLDGRHVPEDSSHGDFTRGQS